MGNFTDRTGEIYKTNEGYNVTIIEYRGSMDCVIQFEDGIIIENKSYQHIKNGKISNPLHPSVCGVGFNGVGQYKTTYQYIITKQYKVWSSMLQRSYDEKYHLRQPTYIGCSVNPDWWNFQVFAKWFDENYIEGFVLDKDVLVKGNKVYSSDTCCFIPQHINSLFIKSNTMRGDLPIGVSYNKLTKKFSALCNINGKVKTLGYFNTPEEAFNAYKIAKEAEIKRVANEYKDTITPECYQAMINYFVEIDD
jgi:hypothetical protein